MSKKRRVTLSEEEIELIQRLRNPELYDDESVLEEECKQAGIPRESTGLVWYKSKRMSISFNSKLNIDYRELFAELAASLPKIKVEDREEVQCSEYACHVIMTDQHVGMDVNPQNRGLFNYLYNEQVYRDSVDKVLQSVLEQHKVYGTFEELVINDLGDHQDGWDGKTTRGGHGLQQNMTNAQVFNVCLTQNVKFIMELVSKGVAKKIIYRPVINANHSADFAEIVAIAVAEVINAVYDKSIVECDPILRFIEQRYYGDHCFIITHGKDKEYRMKPLPYVLDKDTEIFLNGYIKHQGITSKYVHIYKGDQHRLGSQRAKQFDYNNFMSLAPPSPWVQANMGDAYSGYSLRIIPKYKSTVVKIDEPLDHQVRI